MGIETLREHPPSSQSCPWAQLPLLGAGGPGPTGGLMAEIAEGAPRTGTWSQHRPTWSKGTRPPLLPQPLPAAPTLSSLVQIAIRSQLCSQKKEPAE